MSFPRGFEWGVAAASYQIEGGYDEDGKGLSIWDVFSHIPGKIISDDNGDVACDHYHRYREDIAIIKELGIKHYRMSFAWPRIFPNGDTVINDDGVRFYDDLINELLDNGITPHITLYHWDLPQALEDKGGWLNRDITDMFAYYAAFVVKHFSDRVTSFFTINEPQCIAKLGYQIGIHAPGKVSTGAYQVLKVYHHLALAHGKAVTAMRKEAVQPVKIGFASTGRLCYPKEGTDEDIKLSEKLSFQIDEEGYAFNHATFCDEVVFGKYPDLKDMLKEMPADYVLEGDLEICSPKIDFIGVNIYNGTEVSVKVSDYYVPKDIGMPRTSLKWPITPKVMNWGIRHICNRYKLPIIISEDGLACNDKIYLDGKVHDLDRIDFLERYLAELQLAMEAGADVRGYFHWSLTDNYEWNAGYSDRFGLVYIDYPTQKRILKDSAYWYKNYVEQNTN